MKRAPVLCYSGKNSETFWARINAIQGKEWKAAYAMGCALQDLEGRVLQYLDEITPLPQRRKRRQGSRESGGRTT